MTIKKKRIRNANIYLSMIKDDQELYLGVHRTKHNDDILVNKGACDTIAENTSFVPAPIGPITRENVEGKCKVRKDLPKEKRFIPREYHLINWKKEDMYGTYIDERMCFPVEKSDPLLYEIVIDKDTYYSRNIFYKKDEKVILMINIFLEIFGECEIFDTSKKQIVKTIIKRVPWEIIPRGEKVWGERIDECIKKCLKHVNKTNSYCIEKRFKDILSYNPDYICAGQLEFAGYLAICFNSINLSILECCKVDNATYVFDGNWQDVSKLTKKEIIHGHKCKDRIIHNDNWLDNIDRIIKNA